MMIPESSVELTEPADQTETTDAGPWLAVAQKAWLVLALLAAGIMVASLPGYGLRVADSTHGLPIAGPSQLTLALNIVGVTFSEVSCDCLNLFNLKLLWRKL